MAGISPQAGLKLLLTGENSDFTIGCQEVEFKVHKIIIKADSDFCRAVCDRPFKESGEGRLDLPDDRPDIVARVLEYLYTGDYNEAVAPKIAGLPVPTSALSEIHSPAQPSAEDKSDPFQQPLVEIEDIKDSRNHATALETHALVYVCADKLGLARLHTEAGRRFCTVARSHIDHIIIQHALYILRLVFESTPSTDTFVRSYMADYCLRGNRLEFRMAAQDVLQLHEPVLADLGGIYVSKIAVAESVVADRDKRIIYCGKKMEDGRRQYDKVVEDREKATNAVARLNRELAGLKLRHTTLVRGARKAKQLELDQSYEDFLESPPRKRFTISPASSTTSSPLLSPTLQAPRVSCPRRLIDPDTFQRFEARDGRKKT